MNVLLYNFLYYDTILEPKSLVIRNNEPVHELHRGVFESLYFL